MWKYAVFVLAAGAAIAGITMVYWQKTGPAFADASDAALVAQGKTVYADQCASCHGVNLEGQPTWHHPDAHLFQVTKYGTAAVAGPDYKTDMSAFGEILSDTEIWAVLAFIKSRWPAAIQRRHSELNRNQR